MKKSCEKKQSVPRNTEQCVPNTLLGARDDKMNQDYKVLEELDYLHENSKGKQNFGFYLIYHRTWQIFVPKNDQAE